MVHQDGLSASVEATKSNIIGRITAATHKIKAVLDDFRLQAMVGVMGALDLWNMAVVPSLMDNCSTWIGITGKLVDRLESIQERYVRLMLEVPVSTPKIALRAETGLLSMKHRIWSEKMSLVMALKRSKDGLAKQVYMEQLQYGWPGLATEVQEICEKIGVPDINKNYLSKKDMSQALRNHDKAEMMQKMTDNYKKLDKIKLDDPTVPKEYMEKKCLADCRMVFRMRTQMINLKDNMKNMYKGASINCDACDMKVAESQTHVMSCPGYTELRVGKDMSKDGDLVGYFREVLKIREKKKKKKP